MDDRSPPDGHEQRVAITDELAAGLINARETAGRLAELTLKHNDPEASLGQLWASVIILARERPGQLENLADTLIEMAGLPDAKDDKGRPLVVNDMKVWSDLPMLGLEVNEEWNGLEVPQEDPKRTQVIQSFKNINTLAALLVRSGKAAFDYKVFAVWTMREALETTAQQAIIDPPEVFIPAAAAWIAILGRQMYQWDEDFRDSGSGGPLWQGQYGPCRERWQFWKMRFVEISGSEEFTHEVRVTTKKAADMMGEIDGQ